jgi:hypothetical protein
VCIKPGTVQYEAGFSTTGPHPQAGIALAGTLGVERGEPSPGEYNPFWRYYDSFWRGIPPSRAGQVRTWTDRYPGRLLAQQPLYREAFAPSGVKHFMSVGLPAPAGRERNLLFWRVRAPRLLRPRKGAVDPAAPARGGDLHGCGPAAARRPDTA